MLARADWTRQLLDAVEKGKLQIRPTWPSTRSRPWPTTRTSDVRQRGQKLLARGGGLPNADRQKVIEELLPITKEKGDAANGKMVFKNQCAKCHKHAGEGTQIGPDLTGMAVHPKEELLIHILDPSRSVEGNFRLYTRGDHGRARSSSGMLAGEIARRPSS